MVNNGNTRVIITLKIGANFFGSTTSWEASLYSGTEPGEETNGRFTEWKTAVGNIVIFDLPEDVLENENAPFCQERNMYARLRTTEGYPSLDLVSQPITLAYNMEIIIPVIISAPGMSYSLDQHPHLND